MTYRGAIKRAKKAAKDHPGESYYVADDNGYEVLTGWELTFECGQSRSYGDKVVAWVVWLESECEYEVEEYVRQGMVYQEA